MMSMRMCSLLSNVQGEHSRKMMLKRTHCSSRYELEEKSKTLRTTALMAETSTTTRMSQDSLRPSQLLNASIFSLMTSSSRTERLPPELYSNPDICSCCWRLSPSATPRYHLSSTNSRR